MSANSDNQECAKIAIEFHFQEIFTGEQIDILTDDQVLAQVVAKTRFQTGLAHIETLRLCDGEEVVLRIDELNLKTTVRIDVTKPYVTVNLMDGQLHIEYRDITPGYV